MKTEVKQELIKALSGYFPYGLRVQACGNNDYYPTLKGILGDKLFLHFEYITKSVSKSDSTYDLSEIKPYLRPMDTMTEDERIEYECTCDRNYQEFDNSYYYTDTPQSIDYLNEHFFDYRGLIEKGEALLAPDWMYKEFEVGDEVIIYCFDNTTIEVTVTEIRNGQVWGVDHEDGTHHWGNFENVIKKH